MEASAGYAGSASEAETFAGYAGGAGEAEASAGYAGSVGESRAGSLERSADGRAWALGLSGGSVYALGIDSQDSIVLVGDTHGSLSVGPDATLSSDPDDMFVVKVDDEGRYLWGNTGSYMASDVAVTPEDDIVIVGTVQEPIAVHGEAIPQPDERDTLLIKLDPEGNLQWVRLLGGSGWQQWGQVAVNAAGEIFIVGWSDGVLDFGGGPRPSAGDFDAFLAKFTPDGRHLFSMVFGDAQRDEASDVAVASNGDILVAGCFEGHIDLGGGELTTSGFDTKNLFLARYDADGNHLQSQRIASTSRLTSGVIAAAADGGVVLCGEYDRTIRLGETTHTEVSSGDGFLAIFDVEGAVTYSHSFGGESIDACGAVAVGAEGDVFSTGSFGDVVNLGGNDLGDFGGHGVFHARHDPRGTHLGSIAFLSDAWVHARAIGLLRSGRVAIGGYMLEDDTLDLGFASLEGPDAFVAVVPPL